MRRNRWLVCAGAMGVCLSGCGVTWLNAEPRETLERSAAVPGNVYLGWRVFQAHCATCHGPAAEGSTLAPGLLGVMQGMGRHTFSERVLMRYEWRMSTRPITDSADSVDKSIESVVLRRAPAPAMPAWQGDPAVQAHILDLYAYLFARAQGHIGSTPPLN